MTTTTAINSTFEDRGCGQSCSKMPQKLHWRDTNKLFVFRELYVSSFAETSLGKDDIQKGICNGSKTLSL
jgi:hypothetical protein